MHTLKVGRKLVGEERREAIVQQLKNDKTPITGSELAKFSNVSRQVIVSDITILKAQNEPIIATSQGYIYMPTITADEIYEKTIACCHTPEQASDELKLLVDQGVTVKDVIIEHAIYGELTASIMVSNRKEVDQFIRKVKDTNASYLSELTNGIHLHTLTATSEDVLIKAEKALKQAGFLIEEKD